jgi:hypothetical protein
MLFGPLADRAFDRAKGPALVAAAVLVIGTVVFWRVRRRRRATAPGAWMEATCPACIGVSLLAGRVPDVAGLATTNEDRPRANQRKRGCVKRRSAVPALICGPGSYLGGFLLRLVLVRAGCRGRGVLGT